MVDFEIALKCFTKMDVCTEDVDGCIYWFYRCDVCGSWVQDTWVIQHYKFHLATLIINKEIFKQ